INTGIVVAPTKKLKSWLAKLQNNNAQKEYYLTDIVALATKERVPVTAIQADTAWEALGVNSRAQLAELERVYQRKLAASLLEQRSEEHTSELQSLRHLVCRLLLEKKKKIKKSSIKKQYKVL